MDLLNDSGSLGVPFTSFVVVFCIFVGSRTMMRLRRSMLFQSMNAMFAGALSKVWTSEGRCSCGGITCGRKNNNKLFDLKRSSASWCSTEQGCSALLFGCCAFDGARCSLNRDMSSVISTALSTPLAGLGVLGACFLSQAFRADTYCAQVPLLVQLKIKNIEPCINLSHDFENSFVLSLPCRPFPHFVVVLCCYC